MKHISLFSNKSNIKAIFFDFDGVFTNNLVHVDEEGREYVSCSRYDGFGIAALKKHGFYVHVISTETRPLAYHRCKKLGIPCHLDTPSKLDCALQICKEQSISLQEEVCFFGNDINDLELLSSVLFPVVPLDCHVSLKKFPFYSTRLRGGYGCVRELADYILV